MTPRQKIARKHKLQQSILALLAFSDREIYDSWYEDGMQLVSQTMNEMSKTQDIYRSSNETDAT